MSLPKSRMPRKYPMLGEPFSLHELAYASAGAEIFVLGELAGGRRSAPKRLKVINVNAHTEVVTLQAGRGVTLQLGLRSRILTDGAGRTQLLKDCSVCLPHGQHGEIVRLARVLEPESWKEFEAGKGTCSNMAGQLVLMSIERALRVLEAGYRRSPNMNTKANTRAPGGQ